MSGQPKHTPGPWSFRFVGEDVKTPWWVDASATTPGAKRGAPIADVRDIGPESPANATLIAAAPDLLAELELAAFALEQLSRHISEPLAMQSANRARSARAAIAKAKVRS